VTKTAVAEPGILSGQFEQPRDRKLHRLFQQVRPLAQVSCWCLSYGTAEEAIVEWPDCCANNVPPRSMPPQAFGGGCELYMSVFVVWVRRGDGGGDGGGDCGETNAAGGVGSGVACRSIAAGARRGHSPWPQPLRPVRCAKRSWVTVDKFACTNNARGDTSTTTATGRQVRGCIHTDPRPYKS